MQHHKVAIDTHLPEYAFRVSDFLFKRIYNRSGYRLATTEKLQKIQIILHLMLLVRLTAMVQVMIEEDGVKSPGCAYTVGGPCIIQQTANPPLRIEHNSGFIAGALDRLLQLSPVATITGKLIVLDPDNPVDPGVILQYR